MLSKELSDDNIMYFDFFFFQETSEIEEDNQRVENDITSLKKQIEELQQILKDHECSKSKSKNVVVKSEPTS